MKQREIKFRAWDIDNQCLEEVNNVGNILYELQVNPKTDIQENFIMMQFTGLKDKHGKEIYEGDIVILSGHIGIIEWMGAGLTHQGKGDSSKEVVGWSYILGEESEVLGNIYANPELLKP